MPCKAVSNIEQSNTVYLYIYYLILYIYMYYIQVVVRGTIACNGFLRSVFQYFLRLVSVDGVVHSHKTISVPKFLRA